MMNGQLLCRVRVGVTLTFKLREESVLGCDRSLQVVVPVEGVSRKHAKIVFHGGSYWIEDLKSTNGTFLNGQAVTRDRLQHLDVITLGREADLVFVLRAAEAAPPQKVLAIVRAALVPEEPEAAPYEIAAGEITIGRAPSNNLIVDEKAVSKVHARIERTRNQLVLEDLGSANGTFVNGTRLTEAFLKDGDAVSLGGVETYKVVIEMAEVTSASGRHAAMAAPGAAGGSAAAKPRFSAEWKTRMDWSSGEREELAELRQRLDEQEREKQALRDSPGETKKQPVVKPVAKPKAPATPAAKPAADAGTPPVKPVPPAEPAKPAPVAPPVTAAVPAEPPAPAPPPAAASPAVPPAPPAAAKAPPVVPKPPIPPPPAAAPPVKPAAPAAPPVAMPPPRPVAPAAPVKPAGPIATVRLTGAGTSLSVTQPGAYTIGRSREVELRVDHPTVSRKHARLILSDDRTMVYLQDQGGANGTRHNGKEVEKLAPLADGDTIGIGEVDLKVSLERG